MPIAKKKTTTNGRYRAYAKPKATTTKARTAARPKITAQVAERRTIFALNRVGRELELIGKLWKQVA